MPYTEAKEVYVVIIISHSSFKIINSESLLERHLGITPPLLCPTLAAVQIVRVVHAGIGLYLKGIQQIGRMAKRQPPATRQGSQPIPYI